MAERRDSPARLRRLIEQVEPRLRRRFRELVATVKVGLVFNVLVDLIQAGQAEGALFFLERAATMMARESTAAYVLAGEDTARMLSRTLKIVVDFDQVNDRAVQAMSRARLNLIREFSNKQRDAVRESLLDGVRRGANPREMARDFRQSIGLTRSQVAATNNYRRLLQEGSSEALTRELRDRRFDHSVRSVARGDRVLTKPEVDRMVARYSERQLAHRAEVIARTEALRSVHQGSEEGYAQAFESGSLSPDEVVREWNTAKDARVRDSHASMHGQVRGAGEAFLSGSGNLLLYPGDPSAPASETIQCFVPSTPVVAVGVLKGTRHFYSGPVIRVTGPGVDLTVTPNHPILSSRGWVKACDLVAGDYLVKRLSSEDLVSSDPDVANSEPLIADVFYALSTTQAVFRFAVRSAGGAPRCKVNFHGEIPSSDVDVVWSDGELRDRGDATLRHVLGNIGLEDSDILHGKLLVDRMLSHGGLRSPGSPDGLVSIFGKGHSFRGSHLRHADQVCLSASSGGEAKISQARGDNRPASSNMLCHLESGEPMGIHELDGGKVERPPFGVASVVGLETHGYSGFVYNLETESGLVIAAGIVTHNCRCAIGTRIRIQSLALSPGST